MAKKAVEYAMVVVTYDITEDLVNEKIPFIRSYRAIRGFDEIAAVYIDDLPKKKPSKTISFSEPGMHVVKIALEDSTKIPFDLLYGARHVQSVEIPESVTVIEEYAFCCLGLKHMPVLPSGLKEVGRLAFQGACREVEVLQLPDALETIGIEAFRGVEHLITGKCFKDGAADLEHHKKVTIPEDNLYLEVCEGFIINRESKKVEGLLPGIYEDTPQTVLHIPDGVTGFDRSLFNCFTRASIEVPGSVEDCGILFSWRSEGIKVSIAPGVKTVKLMGSHSPANVTFSIPSTVIDFSFRNIVTDTLTIPENAVIRDMVGCCISRLEIGSGVTLKGDTFNKYLFQAFKGEIYFNGTVEFEELGHMNDETIIHVQDNETGLRILNSPGFNKKVKIFIGADQPLEEQAEGYQEQKLFQLLGCPDYKKTLLPLQPGWGNRVPSCVTLMFDFPEKTSLQIKAATSTMMIDDGEPKNLRPKIAMSKGQHIVRLLNLGRIDHEDRWGDSGAPTFEPACETMLIDDTISLKRISKDLKGVKHLILGAKCEIEKITCPVERVSVVPRNKWLEMMDGCLVQKETKTLIFAPAGTTTLPQGIKDIQSYALKNFTHDRLVIPSSVKKIYLSKYTGGLTDLKELVFEEGVEEIIIDDVTFLPDAKITFPSTLKRISLIYVCAGHIEIPVACELDRFSRSKINNLTFAGDVALRPSSSYYNTFNEFSGNITFRGKVIPYIASVSGEEEPGTFIGAMNDDCTITVSDQATCDLIKAAKDYNSNVKIIVTP